MCKLSSEVKSVEIGYEEVGDDDGELICNIQCIRGKPMTERVFIRGLCLEFQIDSGSAVSLIPEQVYVCHFNEVSLKTTNKKLVSFTGDGIEICGVVQLPVTYRSKTQILDLFVVKNSSISLLGRDFIQNFNLELVPVINTIMTSVGLVKELLEKYPTVFSGKLGEFNKYTVGLCLKPDSKPVFF